MSNQIDIYAKTTLDFVQRRVDALCTGESRRGYSYIYLDSANYVFRKLFGYDDLASAIVHCRSYREMRAIFQKIDCEAFVHILSYSNTYRILASMILLRYDIKRKEVDQREERTLTDSIKRMKSDYCIRSDVAAVKYSNLKEYAGDGRGRKDRRGLMDDFDDYPSNRKRHGSAAELFDDDDVYAMSSRLERMSDSDNNYEYNDPGRNELLEYSKSIDNERDRDRSRPRCDDRDYRPSREIEAINKKVEDLTDSLNQMANTMTDYIKVTEEARRSEPRPIQNIDTSQAIQNNSEVRMLNLIKSMSSGIDRKFDTITANVNTALNSLRDDIDDIRDSMYSAAESTPISNNSDGNFVARSVTESLEDEISRSVITGADTQ